MMNKYPDLSTRKSIQNNKTKKSTRFDALLIDSESANELTHTILKGPECVMGNSIRTVHVENSIQMTSSDFGSSDPTEQCFVLITMHCFIEPGCNFECLKV